MAFNPKSYRAGLVYPALRFARTLMRSPEHRALLGVARQLRKEQPFTEGEVEIGSGLKLRYADTASFLCAYDEIFVNQIYKLDDQNRSAYVIDAGANIGLASVFWTLKNPSVEGLAFEPDPKIFAILEDNLKRCQSRIRPVMSALGADEGKCSFESQGGDSGRIRASENVKTIATNPMIEIQKTRLSNYMDQSVDLLKIDIEGSELEVLQEVQSKLSLVKRIFVECHCFRGERDFLPEILGLLRDSGFRLSYDVIAASYRGFELIAPDRQIEVNMNVYGRREIA